MLYMINPSYRVQRIYSMYIIRLFQINCRFRFSCYKFDSICRKRVQYFYFQINLLKKTRFKDIFDDTNYVT
jgi:hypothetical protein